MLKFPDNFLWGSATSSYQIEGAVHEGGRGESIWDRFSHTPGKTFNGDTGDVACDHYHRYPDDVRMMADLGLKAYRFSIAWPRILPAGKGAVNEQGLDFYDRLIDEVCRAGMIPFATLYHWDLPQALEEVGGWLNRETADHFATYTDVISRRLGDRVKQWATFNEPLCISVVSYLAGEHAPGHKDQTFGEAAKVLHHVYVAHGKAIPVLRANVPDSEVGIVLNPTPVHSISDSEQDRAAADRMDVVSNRLYADPILKGEYPALIQAMVGPAMDIQPGDMESMSAPLDFLGINYYTRSLVGHNADANDPLQVRWERPENSEYTEMGWEIYPDGLAEILMRFHNDYKVKSLYVTENGCASPDVIDASGTVHDPMRVAYLASHLRSAHRAISQGVPLKGYFAWSLMDNFEWSHGYAKRFGMVYVDYPTQRRIPKDSYRSYQQVIRDNGVSEA